MGLYGKTAAESHSVALDAMESCLSASHVDVAQPYKMRLEPFKYELLEILGFFDREEQVWEHTQLMRLILDMFDGTYFTGFQINAHSRLIEMCRKRIKGKLMFSRSILADNDKKSACLNPREHRKGCRCKNLAKEKGLL